MLIPKDKIDKWFALAVEALKRGHRVVVINTFNPHYKYWFRYVWPWAAKVLIYKKHVVKFKGYDNPCPKTVAIVLFDPKQRRTPRNTLIKGYVGTKFPYFSIPLKVRKSSTDAA